MEKRVKGDPDNDFEDKIEIREKCLIADFYKPCSFVSLPSLFLKSLKRGRSDLKPPKKNAKSCFEFFELKNSGKNSFNDLGES